MFKNILILMAVILSASCGGGNDTTPADSDQTFSLSTVNSTAQGTIYEAQLAGSDTFGLNYTGSLSISNRAQIMLGGVLVTPHDILTILNSDNTSNNNTLTKYIDTDGNLISSVLNQTELTCTPVSPDSLPTTVKIGDSGIRSTLTCSDGTTTEHSWRVEDAGNGNANFITSGTKKDHFNTFVSISDVTYTINSSGNILALKTIAKTDVWMITYNNI